MGALEDVSRAEGAGNRPAPVRRRGNAARRLVRPCADSLTALVERALAMAREAPEDAFAGLAPDDMLMSGPRADLDLDDGGDPDPAALRVRAPRAEDAARAVPRRHQFQRRQRVGLGVDLRHRHQPRLCRDDALDRL